MSERSDQERLHVIVRGRVQGVGFRAFVIREATATELTGWCRNVGWDKVEVIAEGSRSNLESLLQALHKGPSMAIVDEVLPEWGLATGEFTEFRTR